MPHKNKNIAYFLFLVFIIPVSYQSYHVLLHHSHDESHCCILDDKGKYTFHGDDEKSHCVIADYTFTYKDLPQDYTQSSNSLNFIGINNFYIHSGYRTIKREKKSSRAPPFA